jgi:tRNA (guanine-N7-)-methyltransferase
MENIEQQTKEDILERKRAYFVVQPTERIDFKTLFGNDHPVDIEIGCGKGEFIAAIARRHPERNYLGFELRARRIDNILRKLDIELCPNVRITRLYVDAEIGKLIPLGTMARIYIQHPDPWPKRRHAKHRIIQPEFIDVLYQMLAPDGIVELTTDHPALRGWIVKHFLKRTDFVSLHVNGFTFELPDDHIRTYFDMVNEQAGFPPALMEFRKKEIG